MTYNCPACGSTDTEDNNSLCFNCEYAYKERQEADEQEFCEQMLSEQNFEG